MKQYLHPKAAIEVVVEDICTISNEIAGIGDTKDYSEVVKTLSC